jgi:hypothetical protein
MNAHSIYAIHMLMQQIKWNNIQYLKINVWKYFHRYSDLFNFVASTRIVNYLNYIIDIKILYKQTYTHVSLKKLYKIMIINLSVSKITVKLINSKKEIFHFKNISINFLKSSQYKEWLS